MNFKVQKPTLLFIAGAFWIVAATRIYISILQTLPLISYTPISSLLMGVSALLIFLFFFFIFQTVYHKNTKRILRKNASHHHPIQIFDLKGWFVMFFMITLGIIISITKPFPPQVVVSFYCGLGTALFITGIRFVKKGMQQLNL